MRFPPKGAQTSIASLAKIDAYNKQCRGTGLDAGADRNIGFSLQAVVAIVRCWSSDPKSGREKTRPGSYRSISVVPAAIACFHFSRLYYVFFKDAY
jgi:hypothetical protein